MITPKSSPQSTKTPDTLARRINAALVVGVALFFLGHELMGALAQHLGLSSSVAWLLWIGMLAGGVHVALSALTSYFMMTDTVRPPSAKKRNHLILKWVSGICLIALALLHALTGGMGADPASVALTAILAVALTWHTFVGIKSVLRDLRLTKKYRNLIRVALIIFTVAVIAITLV